MASNEHDRKTYLKLYDDAELEKSIHSNDSAENRYQDKELIGEGAGKKVYRAYDLVVDRYVALAELKHSGNEIKREAFLREAQLTAQLDHPNIISLYDICSGHHEPLWFTMELKTGKHLGQHFSENQDLNLHQRLEAFLKVCDAINYAHSRNILHLDLKPDNIQIGSHGEVLVCDWGLGQMISIEDQDELQRAESEQMEYFKDMTITGKINGTPGFMAPEQIDSKHPKSQQTDIYALGALLYVTLSSKAPLEGELQSMLDNTTNGNITFPKQRFPEQSIPESLDAVVRKAMALHPQDRYRHVTDLQQEIRQYLLGFTTHAESSNLAKELIFFYRRHQMICHATLLSLIIITSLIVVYQSNLNTTLNQLQHANHSFQHERDRAEQALDLAMRNKTWLNDLVLDNEVHLTKSVYDYCAIEIYQDPIKSMDLAIHELNLLKDANPQKSFHTTQLGYCYAIMQKFPESYQAYSEHPPGMKDTLEPIKYMAETYGHQRPLSSDQLIDFLSKMKNGHNPMFALRMLYYDAKLRNNLDEHLQLAHHVLKLWNPEWKNDIFNYDARKKLLRLKGTGLSQLSYHHTANSTTRNWDIIVNLLGSLDIKRLDLSHSDFFDFASLAKLPYPYLNIRHTPIKKLYGIKNFDTLKTLTIHPGQLSQSQIDKLPEHIELIVK